jgi:hypothetical protein
VGEAGDDYEPVPNWVDRFGALRRSLALSPGRCPTATTKAEGRRLSVLRTGDGWTAGHAVYVMFVEQVRALTVHGSAIP